jgi:hypothetical protein
MYQKVEKQVEEIKKKLDKYKSTLDIDKLFNKYSPHFIIEPVKINNIIINVIRDDLLKGGGGTKQRGMVVYMYKSKYKEFIYASPPNGSAQVVISYSADVVGKKATVFTYKNIPRHPLTERASKYKSSKIFEYKKGLIELEKLAEEYKNSINSKKGENYAEHFKLGFNNIDYIIELAEGLKRAISPELIKNPPKRLWVAAGSGTIFKILYVIFPNTHINIVQVGKTIWDDMIIKERTTLYKSDEYFYDKAKIQPPFPTTQSYDAKVWKYILKYGQDGDYFINVTSD